MHIYQIKRKNNRITSYDYESDTLTSELLAYIANNSLRYKFCIELDETDIPNSRHEYIYLDFSYLLSDIQHNLLPDHVINLPTYLDNDLLLDSYKTTKPSIKRVIVKSFSNFDITSEFTLVENPTERLGISDNPRGLNDMVFSDDNYDLSNLIVVVDGNIKRSYMFENELYIEDSSYDFIKNFHMHYINTTPIGGHDSIFIDTLTYTHNTTFHKLLLTLPVDRSFGDTYKGLPILSISGKLYLPTDNVYKVKDQNTIEIDLKFLPDYLHMTEADLVQQIITATDSIIFLFKNIITVEEDSIIPLAYSHLFQYISTEGMFNGIVFNKYLRQILPYRSLDRNGTYDGVNLYQIYIENPSTNYYPLDEYDLTDQYKDHVVDQTYLNKLRRDSIMLVDILTNI